MKYQVSVVMCTYNPEMKKALCTLYSVIRQKNITYEIIITDDGSQIDLTQQYIIFFEKYGFLDYKTVKSEINNGTVENIYRGLMAAEGEYVYVISPGDYLYDQNVLADLYDYSVETGKDFVFGQAVFYHKEDKRIRFYPADNPKYPELFNISARCYNLSVIAYLVENSPIGASYFRKTSAFKAYLCMIRSKVKYLEDLPTTAMYLLDGNKMGYYDKPVIWYEYGTGISTVHSDKWRERILSDQAATEKMLLCRYPESRIVSVKCRKNISERLKNFDISLYSVLYLLIERIRFSCKKVPKSDHYELKKIMHFMND